MEWTNERALQLLKQYKKHPILWNAKHPQYFSRFRKSDAWEQIACYLNLEEYEVKQKMNSLLGSFRREKAKGKDRDKIYKSKWFAFEKMRYLIDKDKETDTTDADNINDEIQSREEDDLNFDSDTSKPVETSKCDLQSKSEHCENSEPPISKKAKIISSYEEPKSEEDDCSIYGQYVANKLRHYRKRTRVEVEHSFNNILYDADIGKYNWPDSNGVNNLLYYQHATAPILSPNSFLQLQSYTRNSTPPHTTCSTPSINYSPPHSTCPVPNLNSPSISTCPTTNPTVLPQTSTPLDSTCPTHNPLHPACPTASSLLLGSP